MTAGDELADQFEAHRGRLRAVAFRMLGSENESDDAVQEAWFRLARTDADDVHNLGGWLTTVVSRICLDLLRSRTARREELVGQHSPDDHPDVGRSDGPEQEAVLVDEVGRAVLVVLDRLSPPERIAFVLHDMFAVPFDEIATVLDRSTATTKKLASRARRRIRGRPVAPTADLDRHRRTVEAFLAASRAGDVDAIITVLAPDVVRTADHGALPAGRAGVVRGASEVAGEIVVFGRQARFAAPALVGGEVGIVVAPHARLRLVLAARFSGDKIAGYELITDPARLARLDVSVLPG